MNIQRAASVALLATLLVACTGGTPPAIGTPEPADPTEADIALIEEWLRVTTDLEWDRSIELMADEVQTPTGRLADSNGIRRYFEGYGCLGVAESVEPVEGSPGRYSVMVRHVAWPDGRCSDEGEVHQYRIDVQDGKITRIP